MNTYRNRYYDMMFRIDSLEPIIEMRKEMVETAFKRYKQKPSKYRKISLSRRLTALKDIKDQQKSLRDILIYLDELATWYAQKRPPMKITAPYSFTDLTTYTRKIIPSKV